MDIRLSGISVNLPLTFLDEWLGQSPEGFPCGRALEIPLCHAIVQSVLEMFDCYLCSNYVSGFFVSSALVVSG